MVAKTALQVPLTCDIPQVASQIERHPAIRCQCAQKRNKGVVSSARPELQLVIGRDKTLCSKFQEMLLPKIKPCWWMTGTYIAHCRTLIHAPCTWHFGRSPPTPKLHSSNCFVHCQELSLYRSIQYLFPYASSSKHWHRNAWYVGPHGPRYWDATHLGSKFHSKALEAIDLRESPGEDPRKPWRAAQISSQRFDACRYLRVNALTSCQHIAIWCDIGDIMLWKRLSIESEWFGLFSLHLIDCFLTLRMHKDSRLRDVEGWQLRIFEKLAVCQIQ